MAKRRKKSKERNIIAVGGPQAFIDVTGLREPGTKGARSTEREYFIWQAWKYRKPEERSSKSIRKLAKNYFGSWESKNRSKVERVLKKVEAEQRAGKHPPNEANCPCGTKFVEKSSEAAWEKMHNHLERDCPFRTRGSSTALPQT